MSVVSLSLQVSDADMRIDTYYLLLTYYLLMTKILYIFNKFFGEDKKTFMFFKHRFQESQFFDDKIFSFKVNFE